VANSVIDGGEHDTLQNDHRCLEMVTDQVSVDFTRPGPTVVVSAYHDESLHGRGINMSEMFVKMFTHSCVQ